jgi:hypothetical protein
VERSSTQRPGTGGADRPASSQFLPFPDRPQVGKPAGWPEINFSMKNTIFSLVLFSYFYDCFPAEPPLTLQA